MSENSWKEILEDIDVNTGFERFHTALRMSIDKHAPEKERKVSYNRIIRDPWIITSLMKSLTKQKRLYKELLTTKTDQAKQKYTNYRNTLKKLLRHSRIKFIRDKCEEYKQNSRKLWELINRIVGKENNKKHVIDSIKVQEKHIYDPKGITSELCTFFANIGEKYARNITQTKQVLMNTSIRCLHMNNHYSYCLPPNKK